MGLCLAPDPCPQALQAQLLLVLQTQSVGGVCCPLCLPLCYRRGLPCTFVGPDTADTCTAGGA
jgi:hypothetical protein